MDDLSGEAQKRCSLSSCGSELALDPPGVPDPDVGLLGSCLTSAPSCLSGPQSPLFFSPVKRVVWITGFPGSFQLRRPTRL